MDVRLNTRRILIFLAFAVGIPWATALAFYLSGWVESNPVAAGTMANYVFISTPALANVATRLITREGWGQLRLRPNFRRSWRFYLAAWLLPFLAAIVGGGIYYLLFPQSFDPDLGALQKLLAGSPLAANPWTGMLVITLQVLIVGLTINAVASIGEEFGWRAYLLPRLVERFAGAGRGNASAESPAPADVPDAAGARKASLLIGVIWGVWHWPLFFMAARVDPGAAFPFPLVYLIFTSSLSVLLSWVTLRSGSVWPAAVGHGTINSTSVLAGFLLKGPAGPLLGPAPSGLIGVLGYLVLALVLYFNRGALAEEKEAGS